PHSDLLALGRAYRKAGQFRSARAAFMQAYLQDPEHNTVSAFEAGMACLQWPHEPLLPEESVGQTWQSPTEAARDLLKTVTDRVTDHAMGWQGFGQALMQLGQLEDATQKLDNKV